MALSQAMNQHVMMCWDSPTSPPCKPHLEFSAEWVPMQAKPKFQARTEVEALASYANRFVGT